MEISVENFNDYVVIGLGKFGRSMAVNLADAGKNVLAVDTEANNVASVEGSVTHAVVADVTKAEVLKALGVQNFDCAIICIGDNLSASLLATEICKELEVPYIIAKAQSEQHKSLLSKIGADLVVFPEVYMSKKLTASLLDPYANEVLKLTKNYKIVEVKCPENWIGKTVEELNIRKKHSVTVIFVKRGDEEIIEPVAETVFEEGDNLVVAGKPKNIDSLENKVEDVLDLKQVFQDATSEGATEE